MTYQKSLGLGEQNRLLPIFEKILSLAPGKSIILSSSSSQERDRTRTSLYVWLRNANLKQDFRIKRIGAQNLIIERPVSEVPSIITVEDSLPSHLEEFLLSTLLPLSSEEEAKDAISKHSFLPPEEDLLFKEWKRIQGISE